MREAALRRVCCLLQALGGDTWLQGGLSGTQRTGGLTEAQLTDELGPDILQLPIPRNASATISWWQVRQAAFDRALQVSTPHEAHPSRLLYCLPSSSPADSHNQILGTDVLRQAPKSDADVNSWPQKGSCHLIDVMDCGTAGQACTDAKAGSKQS